MRHVTLRNRIKRIEQRRAFQRSRCLILYTVTSAMQLHIVGIGQPSGPVTARRRGEALEALASRHAGAAMSARIGFAVYEAGSLDFLA